GGVRVGPTHAQRTLALIAMRRLPLRIELTLLQQLPGGLVGRSQLGLLVSCARPGQRSRSRSPFTSGCFQNAGTRLAWIGSLGFGCRGVNRAGDEEFIDVLLGPEVEARDQLAGS